MKPDAGGNDPGKAESLSNRVLGWLQPIRLALWPRLCFVCGEEAGLEILCEACEAELPRLQGGVCPVCGLPSPHGETCGACLRRAPNFDATLALFAYAGPVREMVLAIKHGRGFGIAPWLGRLMAFKLRESGIEAELILPMPLHKTRLRQRGFNQAVELARPIRSETGWAFERELVIRDIDTPCLEGLRRKERQRAVRGAFRCVKPLSGQHVLVVDDVMTSGATLDELAACLKQQGAARVSNLVIARTLRQAR